MGAEMPIFDSLKKFGKSFSADVVAATIVQGRHAGVQTTGEKGIKPISYEDNVRFGLLISETEINHGWPIGGLWEKLAQFIQHIWSEMDNPIDKPIKERLKKIAAGSIRVNAAHVATWNQLSEAQQMLALPLISYFAEASLVDWNKAVQHLHNFANQSVEQMYQNYILVIAQPERLHDAIRRQVFAGWDKLQERLEKRRQLAQTVDWSPKDEPL